MSLLLLSSTIIRILIYVTYAIFPLLENCHHSLLLKTKLTTRTDFQSKVDEATFYVSSLYLVFFNLQKTFLLVWRHYITY